MPKDLTGRLDDKLNFQRYRDDTYVINISRSQGIAGSTP